MYLSLIVTFLLVLILAISGVQNSLSVDLKLIAWKLQMSLTALIFYSALLGGAIVAVLTLPKLVSKSLKVRKLKKEIYELKKKALDIEKVHEEGS
jgi:uncharacterized integral membrane protein